MFLKDRRNSLWNEVGSDYLWFQLIYIRSWKLHNICHRARPTTSLWPPCFPTWANEWGKRLLSACLPALGWTTASGSLLPKSTTRTAMTSSTKSQRWSARGTSHVARRSRSPKTVPAVSSSAVSKRSSFRTLTKPTSCFWLGAKISRFQIYKNLLFIVANEGRNNTRYKRPKHST